MISDVRCRLAFVPAGQSVDFTFFADEAERVRSIGRIAMQVGARPDGTIYAPEKQGASTPLLAQMLRLTREAV